MLEREHRGIALLGVLEEEFFMAMYYFTGAANWRKAMQPRNLLFLIGVALAFAFFSAPEYFSPWCHFTGGSFHLVPWWSGAGSFTGPDGKYQIYLFVKPMNEKHATWDTSLVGEGDLCTPRGEKLRIHISGDMDKHLGLDTVGKKIEISTYVPSRFGFGGITPPGSPYVKLTGTWGVGKIEATGVLDHQPVDGKPAPEKPAPIAVTLREASDWASPPCPAW
jgi:hypothetical protein